MGHESTYEMVGGRLVQTHGRTDLTVGESAAIAADGAWQTVAQPVSHVWEQAGQGAYGDEIWGLQNYYGRVGTAVRHMQAGVADVASLVPRIYRFTAGGGYEDFSGNFANNPTGGLLGAFLESSNNGVSATLEEASETLAPAGVGQNEPLSVRGAYGLSKFVGNVVALEGPAVIGGRLIQVSSKLRGASAAPKPKPSAPPPKVTEVGAGSAKASAGGTSGAAAPRTPKAQAPAGPKPEAATPPAQATKPPVTAPKAATAQAPAATSRSAAAPKATQAAAPAGTAAPAAPKAAAPAPKPAAQGTQTAAAKHAAPKAQAQAPAQPRPKPAGESTAQKARSAAFGDTKAHVRKNGNGRTTRIEHKRAGVLPTAGKTAWRHKGKLAALGAWLGKDAIGRWLMSKWATTVLMAAGAALFGVAKNISQADGFFGKIGAVLTAPFTLLKWGALGLAAYGGLKAFMPGFNEYVEGPINAQAHSLMKDWDARVQSEEALAAVPKHTNPNEEILAQIQPDAAQQPLAGEQVAQISQVFGTAGDIEGPDVPEGSDLAGTFGRQKGARRPGTADRIAAEDSFTRGARRRRHDKTRQKRGGPDLGAPDAAIA